MYREGLVLNSVRSGNQTRERAACVVLVMDMLKLVSGVATVSTIGVFSAGILICRKIHASKSVGVVPHLPFVAALINCSLWMTYGFLKPDIMVLLVNLVGDVLQLFYILIYHTYAESKYGIRRDFSIALAIVIPVALYYSFFVSDKSSLLTQLGIICNFFTICFFASPLSTMVQVIRSQSTETMSLPLSFMSAICTASWTIYGVLVKDVYIQFPNSMGLLLSLIQLSLFAIYRQKKTIVSLETPMV